MLIGETRPLTAGWLVSSSAALASERGFSLSVAFPMVGTAGIQRLVGRHITYFGFPRPSVRAIKTGVKEYLAVILEEVSPDVVHVFGTEYRHALSMVYLCREARIPAVISIQGLVSVIAEHYGAGLPPRVQTRSSFRDILRQDNVSQQQSGFRARGRSEVAAIQGVKHVIGRTTWDRACVQQINADAQYYSCDETLREGFYQGKWSVSTCERHTIFMSQAYYAIKGLHWMLQAMPLILQGFPDAKLFVGGPDIIRSGSLTGAIRRSAYGQYLLELIKKNDLGRSVFFLGPLDEQGMREQYLKTHVFALTSSIENSPNSLAEAMLLGVPCVSSYVGGVPDLLEHNMEGYTYQADAPYMLAYWIGQIFRDDDVAVRLSTNARSRASLRHSIGKNTQALIEIYQAIADGTSGRTSVEP